MTQKMTGLQNPNTIRNQAQVNQSELRWTLVSLPICLNESTKLPKLDDQEDILDDSKFKWAEWVEQLLNESTLRLEDLNDQFLNESTPSLKESINLYESIIFAWVDRKSKSIEWSVP